MVFSDSHAVCMECYWETSVEDPNYFIVKQVIFSEVKTLMYVELRECWTGSHSNDFWLIFISNYGNVSVCKMLFIFFFVWIQNNYSCFFGGGCIANFRNFKSLHVMEEDITVLKQLLSNTALLFRNRPVLPTHCGEMYVISRWLAFQLFFWVSLRSQRKWNNKSWKE